MTKGKTKRGGFVGFPLLFSQCWSVERAGLVERDRPRLTAAFCSFVRGLLLPYQSCYSPSADDISRPRVYFCVCVCGQLCDGSILILTMLDPFLDDVMEHIDGAVKVSEITELLRAEYGIVTGKTYITRCVPT